MLLVLFSICFLYGIFGDNKGQSMIKEIDGIIYIGGKNSLSSYMLSDDTHILTEITRKRYLWTEGIMNGSDIGQEWSSYRWPKGSPKGPSSLAFDNCLNWKQENLNETVRKTAFDFQRSFYHTPSGDFETMSYTCLSSFIKGIEPLDNDTLWVCGTFGAFPRAFSVNKTSLEFIKFIDKSVMSCSRYVDEPMATYVDNITKSRYVASGWGLYRPDNKDPDVPNNNSTMLYADWRLYRNLFTLPAALATVLSSDVNFIDVVKETSDHLYFFGHEINNQYGLNNRDDRNAWQSFMLRICKNDLGFKYDLQDEMKSIRSLEATYYNTLEANPRDFNVAPNFNDLEIKNLPSTHFVTPIKINFGCYISKRPRAISDNHFWGETNVVYLNKLVDVVFDPMEKIQFTTKTRKDLFGCKNIPHSQTPLLGLFNGPGIVGSGVEPTGALCQLQINRNIFVEEGSRQSHYYKNNVMSITDALDELLTVSSTTTPNFYEKTLHRTNGITMYPWWNQGVMIGRSTTSRDSYKKVFKNVGKCQSKEFYKSLNLEGFRRIHNFTNTAWPNEIANRFTSLAQAMCQYYSAELLQFNASFVIPSVEFKRMFIISKNITTYVMHKIDEEKSNETSFRRFTSPLMIVGIISTKGMFYRVVLCDFDSGMINHGYDKTSGSWYNWCIFRHTNQPYLYRQYTPMEDREFGESSLYRASSLLSEKMVVDPSDLSSYPINRDPQFHVVKGIFRKDTFLHVITTNNIHKVSLKVNCTDYRRCIDCASDPDCMWSNGKRTCVKYKEDSYKEENFIQDILDRGFKCLINLPRDNIENVTENKDILHCSNSGFWRGNIIWKSNDTQITNVNQRFIIDNDFLYFLNHSSYIFGNISCHGVKEDHDKLYHAKEYLWLQTNNVQEVQLNVFRIIKDDPVVQRFDYTVFFFSLSLAANLVLIIIIVNNFHKRVYRISFLKNNEDCHSIQNVPSTAETLLDKID